MSSCPTIGNTCLVQLEKMLILIKINILDMELDMTVLEYPSGGSGRNVIIFGID